MRKPIPVRAAVSTPELARRWLRAPTPDNGKVWRALMLLQQGHSPSKVARALGIHRNTLLNWKKQYNAAGDAFVPPRSPRPTAPREE